MDGLTAETDVKVEKNEVAKTSARALQTAQSSSVSFQERTVEKLWGGDLVLCVAVRVRRATAERLCPCKPCVCQSISLRALILLVHACGSHSDAQGQYARPTCGSRARRTPRKNVLAVDAKHKCLSKLCDSTPRPAYTSLDVLFWVSLCWSNPH
eukprot:6191359-Pleurochrysis_carterae.AAC.13